ncbi:MAG: tRNA dihydrouridine(20/20a) synthase DusA, partial [Leptolyngbya sp. SIO1D8]|nr:tRNA dihydrouridine(20/20a) synthase DusA [Leptolyngbya sp. SIO1D8]
SPKENRTIPPLRYEVVYRLKKELPHLWIEINGGVTTLEQAQAHRRSVDAVMIGRAAYDNPYLFAPADTLFFEDATTPLTRSQVVEAMLPYIQHWVAQGLKLNSITRHMLMLFHGQPGSRLWRRLITEQACRPGAGIDVVKSAVAAVEKAADIAVTLG